MSKRLFGRVAAAGALAVVAAVLGTSPALAHERRTVGAYNFVVGWTTEPTYVGFQNNVQLFVRLPDNSPVTDIGDALKVEVIFGTERVGPMALAPAFNSPGEYRAPLIPSRPGSYTFRFVGSVRGQAVDQSFTSSPTGFDSADDPKEIAFPAKDPSTAELAQRLERLDPRLTQLAGDADDARSAADRAAILAVALGIVALGVAGLGLSMALRARRPARAGKPSGEPARL